MRKTFIENVEARPVCIVSGGVSGARPVFVYIHHHTCKRNDAFVEIISQTNKGLFVVAQVNK